VEDTEKIITSSLRALLRAGQSNPVKILLGLLYKFHVVAFKWSLIIILDCFALLFARLAMTAIPESESFK